MTVKSDDDADVFERKSKYVGFFWGKSSVNYFPKTEEAD